MRISKTLLALGLGAVLASSSMFAQADDKVVIGFSQIGAESEWRTANTNDVKAAAEEMGIELKFSDAQQKQENQIKAIRTFIAQKVDLIGFVPIVETGWDNILREAKRAKIPVIKAFNWIDEYCTKNNLKPRNGGDVINIAILEGTVGASAATGRGNGFNAALDASPNKAKYKIIASQTGDFTRAKGQEVMESYLKSFGGDIDVLFAHNDDMALGAIQAIEAAGLKPGKDIVIVGCDAVKGMFQAMIDGKANCTIECNPLQGKIFFETALKVLKGEPVQKQVYVEEGVFPAEVAAEVFPTRKY